MHAGAENCEDDCGEGEQEQATDLAAAFVLFQKRSFVAGFGGLWDGLRVF